MMGKAGHIGMSAAMNPGGAMQAAGGAGKSMMEKFKDFHNTAQSSIKPQNMVNKLQNQFNKFGSK